MTEINWPETLPLPSAGLTGENLASVVRTEMESGRVRQRARFGTSADSYSVEWLFLPGEYAEFLEFYNATLKNGVLYFNLPLPETEDLAPVPVRFVGGQLSKTYVPHMQWRVSGKVEREIVQEIPDPEIDIMPLIQTRTVEVTEDFTLSMLYQNALIRVNSSDPVTITLPANANFTDVFNCIVTRIGTGSVEFAGQGGVIVDSTEDRVRIFSMDSGVSVHYVASNRFQLIGDLY